MTAAAPPVPLGMDAADAAIAALNARTPRGPERRFLRRALSVLRAWRYYDPADGYRTLAAFDGPDLVAFNVHRASRRVDPAWGRYVACDYAYTAPDCRRRGLASGLYRAARAAWVAGGCHRLRTTVCSPEGFALHRSLGHTFWGLNAKGELVIDHPLVRAYARDGVPPDVLRRCPAAYGPLPAAEAAALFLAPGPGRPGGCRA